MFESVLMESGDEFDGKVEGKGEKLWRWWYPAGSRGLVEWT